MKCGRARSCGCLRVENHQAIGEAHRITDPALLEESRRKRQRTVLRGLLRRKYGMTVEEYDRLLEKQDGKCAICRRMAKLHIDHCHPKERTRGLLCASCNLAIGLLKEDLGTLRNAIFYIENWRGILGHI